MPGDELVAHLQQQNKLLEQHLAEMKKLVWEAATSRRAGEVVRLASAAPILHEVQTFADEVQLGMLETVTKIRDEGLSFSRFGDGEMRMMLRPDYNLKFQTNSPALAAGLRSVLTDPPPQTLIGFPHVYRDIHWTGVWCDIWYQVRPLVAPFTRMGNSHVSRPIFFQFTGHEGVEVWRSVWAGKSVLVVTGQDSRFEVMPQLFSSAASMARLDSLPINAFADMPRIMDLLARDTSDLILVSLGPAGTVLASELARSGRQAIDIGHITDSYENVFQGGLWPEKKSVTT